MIRYVNTNELFNEMKKRKNLYKFLQDMNFKMELVTESKGNQSAIQAEKEELKIFDASHNDGKLSIMDSLYDDERQEYFLEAVGMYRSLDISFSDSVSEKIIISDRDKSILFEISVYEEIDKIELEMFDDRKSQSSEGIRLSLSIWEDNVEDFSWQAIRTCLGGEGSAYMRDVSIEDESFVDSMRDLLLFSYLDEREYVVLIMNYLRHYNHRLENILSIDFSIDTNIDSKKVLTKKR